jgi:hypothetical protein
MARNSFYVAESGGAVGVAGETPALRFGVLTNH